MEICARERQRKPLALLVRQEAQCVLDVEPLRKLDHLGMPSAEARDDDEQVIEVAEERRSTHQAVEILGMTDVSGVHDDELLREVVALRPRRCRAVGG